jgi:nitrous oxidase accessory protein NosD
MFKHKYPLLLLISVLMFLAGCDQSGDLLGTDREVKTVRFANFGQVGIVFQNGVECLGEAAQPIAGDVVYVSPHGDNGNPGTSKNAPLRTLAYAVCNLRPGQTLNVLPGVYTEAVILGAFGDRRAPITIRGLMDGDQRPILEGESSRTMGIGLVECENFIIENLEFRNYTDEGVLILVGSNFAIQNNIFNANGRDSFDPDQYGEGYGINVVGARDVLLEGNQALGNGPNQEGWENHNLGMGINTYEISDSIIRDNDSHDNIGGGILVENGSNVLVENNRISGNELDANGDYWDGGIWVDGGQHITLRGNVITDNHGPGMNLSDEDVQYPTASLGYIVENNTVTNNLFGVYTWNFGRCPVPEDAILLLDNQIEDNTEMDLWCTEWACGVEEPCD